VYYFLTGLPRTRTAWFSEYLPNCLHEGMEGCFTWNQYTDKLTGGDSSCCLMYFPIKDLFPESKIVIIERDMEEVVESLRGIDLFDDEVLSMLYESKDRLDDMQGLRVDYHSLDMEEIWTYLIGDGFNQGYTDILNKVNIQKINRNPDIKAFQSLLGEL